MPFESSPILSATESSADMRTGASNKLCNSFPTLDGGQETQLCHVCCGLPAHVRLA